MPRRTLIRPRLLLLAAVLALAATLAGVEYARSISGLPGVPYSPKNHPVTPARVLTPASESPRVASAGSAIRHYEYVFPNGEMVVYDIDHSHRLVQRVELPDAHTIRGVAVDPKTHLLYVSYGGDGDGNGNGSMLKYDLLRDRILWEKDYSTGIDSMAITHDGRRIYMPVGELNPFDSWEVIDTRDGRVLTRIHAGQGPHNTVMGLSGRYVYLAPRDSPWLVVVSTRTNKIVRKIGPMKSGVRPTTVNGKETIAYTTATRFLGFQVSSIRTGKVLYTVPIRGFSWSPNTYQNSAPSHGISLSPDEKEVWVMDGPNSYVHVYDVSGIPAHAPRHPRRHQAHASCHRRRAALRLRLQPQRLAPAQPQRALRLCRQLRRRDRHAHAEGRVRPAAAVRLEEDARARLAPGRPGVHDDAQRARVPPLMDELSGVLIRTASGQTAARVRGARGRCALANQRNRHGV